MFAQHVIEIQEPVMPLIKMLSVNLTGPDACREAEQLLREQEDAGMMLLEKNIHIAHFVAGDTACWRGTLYLMPGQPKKGGELTVRFFDPDTGEPAPELRKAAIKALKTRWDGFVYHVLISRG